MSARYLVGLLALSLPGCLAEATERAPLRVAAAADLRMAFEELGRRFESETGQKVSFSFGSTGLLAKQLREGAPFDLFAAANVSFVDGVIGAGVCDGATKQPYARGRLAVWSRADLGSPPTSLADLADPRFARIAIANPEHAPYGQAAQRALEREALWSTVKPKLVLGDNVRQTLQFAESGNAQAAIVALALVVRDHENPWFLVDESMHPPIEQAMVVCTGGKQRALGEAFAGFVDSPTGRSIMRRYGFRLPGEQRAALP